MRKSTKVSPVWVHNSYFGHARMMEEQAKAIIKSPTTTSATKDCAARIMHEARMLGQLLKERVK